MAEKTLAYEEENYKYFNIPQISFGQAHLLFLRPVTKENMDIIKNWFEEFTETIIDEVRPDIKEQEIESK